MRDFSLVALAVTTIGAFVISGVWYGVFSKHLAGLSPAYAEQSGFSVTTVLVELARSAVVAVVIAGLVSQLDLTSFGAGMLLGLALWIGFPVVLLTGSVIHEQVPLALAAIHAGDWLLKLLLFSAVLTVWR